ncbi:protocadherin gamma-B1-like [Gastrophryne carolinensis]
MDMQVVFILISFTCTHIAAQIYYSVPEELKQGTAVGNVAKDLGLNVHELSSRKFHIVSRGKMQYFNVNLENGDLYVGERIDREMLCGIKPGCFMSFEAVIENPLQLYTIKVEIQDINDNAPSFAKNVFDIVISESAVPGVRLALGHAQDPDVGTNYVEDYKISESEFFELGEKVTPEGIKFPELILKKVLDREKQNMYELVLTATDGGQPPKTGNAIIKIKVRDANDNFPKFSKYTYKARVNENMPPGSMILQLHAEDEDEGSNAEITFSFLDISQTIDHLFSIDPKNGSIFVKGSLDYEAEDRYELTVEAKDGGDLASHCKVLIQIMDINDNPPEITFTSVLDKVPENSPPDTVIALVHVHDLDSGDNGEVTCQISDVLPFQLISSSTNYYKLVTSATIDREKTSLFTIAITATDNGYPPLSTNKTIPLFILDVNDNAPMFDQLSYVVYVHENNPQGTPLRSMQASDNDSNENAKISYSLLSNAMDGIPVSSYVSINSVSGTIYAQRSFDYEHLREFQFQVMAKDDGSPPLNSNVTVKICIIDKNDNPPKLLYPSPETEESAVFEFIPHSAQKGYLVTKVIAVDADSGHNAWLSYHLQQISDPSLFVIGKHSGEIRVARDLSDMESLRQKIVVLVKDNGVPSLSSTVTLSLVVAENFQQVVPEIRHQPNPSESSSKVTLYLIVFIAVISLLFVITVGVIVILKCKCRKIHTPTSLGTFGRNVYPQFTLGCPSEISDTSLPFPFSYDVCVTLDSKQNEIAYLKSTQNVPTDNLIDTESDSTVTKNQAAQVRNQK